MPNFFIVLHFSPFIPPKWSEMIQHPILVVLHFPIFSYKSGLKWFGIYNFGCSSIFPIFSHQSGQMIQHTQFWVLHFSQSFPTKVVWNDSECPILNVLHFCPSFPTKVSQNNLEGLILGILHCFPILNCNTCGFNSERWLPCWKLCHKPYSFLVSTENYCKRQMAPQKRVTINIKCKDLHKRRTS